MISLNKKDVPLSDFVGLLENTKKATLRRFQPTSVSESPKALDFERAVYEDMSKSAEGTEYAGFVKHVSRNAFPDIVVKKYFGVEVKMTIGNNWGSVGNSVLETTRVKDVEKIYMYFGKFGGYVDVKYRPYQECLSDIVVTHYPRYKIDMNLAKEISVFDKMGVSYNELRTNPKPVALVKAFYRKQLKEGEELWWMDEGGEGTSPIIRPFSKLTSEEKDSFMVEAMVLFPEIFGSGSLKYERVAAYLVTSRSVVSASLRDSFSAGGQEKLVVKGKTILMSKMLYKMFSKANEIKSLLSDADSSLLVTYWRSDTLAEDRVGQWLEMLDHHSSWETNGLRPSDVFKAGLA